MFSPQNQNGSNLQKNSPGRSLEGSVKSYQVAEDKREAKSKRKRKSTKPVMEFDYEPVRLPTKPHYEDITQDEDLKFLVPKLRKQMHQKEAEEKY